MTIRFFGSEAEYAFAAVGVGGEAFPREVALARLMQRAARRPHLKARTHSGIFLENASLLYIDCGHPELATAEVTSPAEACRYIKAGEAILEELCREVECAHDIDYVMISRSNVSYIPRATWACHESIGHRIASMNALARHLIPHLASRIVYAGAGGFNVSPAAGIEFMLAPRACFLDYEFSHNSTEERGIFHGKDEAFGDLTYRRLHILAGSSLYGERGIWLKTASTACIVALIEAGIEPAEQMRLADSVAAMRQFARDPTLTATAAVRCGKSLTALDIQRAYLEAVERHRELPTMPSWVDEACGVWRATLDRLQSDPTSAERTTDWGVKLRLFRDFLEQNNLPWESLARWNQVFGRLARMGEREDEDDDPCLLGWRLANADNHAGRGRRLRLRSLVGSLDLDIDEIPRMLELRNELFELDMKFGQLGERGLFAALDSVGLMDHRVEGIGSIEAAKTQPPQVGRARLRGRCVRKLHGERFLCDWAGVYGRHKYLDLSNPFAEEQQWTAFPEQLDGPAIERSRSTRELLEEITAAIRRRRNG